MKANFTVIEEQRTISVFKQFLLVLNRMYINTLRDELGVMQISTIGLGAGLVSGVVYYKVGELNFGENITTDVYNLTDF